MSRSNSAVLLTLILIAVCEAEEVTVSDAVVTLKREVRLPASEPGIIQTVHVEEGEMVKKDDPIITLDDAKLTLELLAAARQADVARLESENDVDAQYAAKSQEVSAAELRRAEDAVRRHAKSVSKSELDQMRLVMERARLSAEQADRDMQTASLRAELEQARVEIASARLEDMTIRAPLDGMVVQLQKHVGEWVAVGEPVARVIQLDQLRAEGFVDGRKYDQGLNGNPATLAVTLPDGRQAAFDGTVTFVSAELHPISGLVKIWVEVQNPDHILRPGMRGQLIIQE